MTGLRSKYAPRAARPKADKKFTDRESAIEAFRAIRELREATSHKVLTFYGVGGQGKTSLCKELLRILKEEKPRSTLWGHLDFRMEQLRSADRALLWLRRSIRASGKIRCPAFDIAFLNYWNKSYPEAQFQDVCKDIVNDSEGVLTHALDTAAEASEELPAGLGLGFKALNWLRRKTKVAWAKRAITALQGFEALELSDVLDRLPYYLGEDLRVFLQREDAKELVIFLDTYEALWTGRDTGWESDAWVRELIASAPGVTFVIFCRERLDWDRLDPDDWKGKLDNQLRLEGLSNSDAHEFLRRIPIDDAKIREAIVVAAAGLPLYLDLQVEHFLDLVEAGEHPTAGHFGDTEHDVLAAFLRYRTDQERATLRILAVAHSFGSDLFRKLVRRFHTGYPISALEDFVRFSFIDQGSDNRYRIHSLMRDHLLAGLGSDIRREVEQFLFEFYDASCQPTSPKDVLPEQEVALVEAFQHLNNTRPDLAFWMEWIGERPRPFQKAGRYVLVQRMFDEALNLLESHLGPEHAFVATIVCRLGGLHLDQENYAAADPLYLRALALLQKDFGTENPIVAPALKGLARICKSRGLHSEADVLYQRALRMFEQKAEGSADADMMNCLNDLGELRRAQGQYGDAVLLCRRALVMREKALGPEHPHVAQSLNNLAGLQHQLGKLDDAETMYLRALHIWEGSIGTAHPHFAVTLNNLAGIYRDARKFDKAEPLYERAIRITRETLGPEHLRVAEVLNNYADLLRNMGRGDDATRIAKQAESLGASLHR